MTNHPYLTLELVRATMDEIVKDAPHRTVKACRYSNLYGGPACVVGTMLFKLGWTYEELHEFDYSSACGGSQSFKGLVDSGRIDADRAATSYLDIMQGQQDGGETWITAYRMAESWLIQLEENSNA